MASRCRNVWAVQPSGNALETSRVTLPGGTLTGGSDVVGVHACNQGGRTRVVPLAAHLALMLPTSGGWVFPNGSAAGSSSR